MVYVSMIEIFFKSLNALSDEWCPDREVGETCPKAYGVTTAFFFAGLALCALLNVFTHNLENIVNFLWGGCVMQKTRRTKGVTRGEAKTGCSEEAIESGMNSETHLVADDPDLEEGVPLPRGWHVELTKSRRPIFCNQETGTRQWECPQTMGCIDSGMIGIELTEEPVHPNEAASIAMLGTPSTICACHGPSGGCKDKDSNDAASGGNAALTGLDAESTHKLKMTGILTGVAIVRQPPLPYDMHAPSQAEPFAPWCGVYSAPPSLPQHPHTPKKLPQHGAEAHLRCKARLLHPLPCVLCSNMVPLCLSP